MSSRALGLLIVASSIPCGLRGEDCNGNGIDDRVEVTEYGFDFFSLTKTYPIAGEPLVILTADLDGDGDADVATGNHGTVSVLLQEAGDLGAAADYPALNLTPGLAAADLDADGDLDLAAGGEQGGLSGAVAVLRNLGGGSFQAEAAIAASRGVRDLAAADLDGDGRPDLAAAIPFKVLVFLNAGGQLAAPLELAVDSNPFAIEAGDWNGDGLADLATANVPGHPGIPDDVSVFLSRGGGEFEPARNFPAGRGLPDLASGDLDRDGNLDLVVSNATSGTVTGLYGDGDGGFDSRELLSLNPQPPGEALWLAVEDLDGDGDLDLAAVEPRPSDVVVAFQDAQGDFKMLAGLGVAGRARALSAADMDGDGDRDIVVSHGGGLNVLRNRGGGRFVGGALRARTCGLPEGSYAVSVADLNGDGRLDVLSEDYEQVDVLLQSRQGGFLSPASYPLCGGHPPGFRCFRRAGGRPQSPVTIADLSGDGMPDLAAFSYEQDPERKVWVLRNRGDGSFEEAGPYGVGVDDPPHLIAADLDGDGLAELVTASGACNYFVQDPRVISRDLAVIRNLGSSEFAEAVTYDSGLIPDRPVSWLAAEDFNLDGALDVAAVIPDADSICGVRVVGNSSIAVFLNEGRGSLLPATTHTVGKNARRVVVADLNADGSKDIAAPSRAFERGGTPLPVGEMVSVLLNDAPAGFPGTATLYPAGEQSSSLLAEDLDEDGRIDLVTATSVLYGAGGGLFQPEDGSEHYGGTLIADLNSDGRKDLLPWFLNSGGRAFEPLANPAYGTPADLDGDGRLDLARADEREDGSGGWESFVTLLLSSPASMTPDRNENGIPDECEPPSRPRFHRGDPNGDGRTDMSDAVAVLGFLFLGHDEPACRESADANNDARIDITDPVSLLGYLFLGGPPPALPGPSGSVCGEDPDPPGSVGDLGCLEYSHCGGDHEG